MPQFNYNYRFSFKRYAEESLILHNVFYKHEHTYLKFIYVQKNLRFSLAKMLQQVTGDEWNKKSYFSLQLIFIYQKNVVDFYVGELWLCWLFLVFACATFHWLIVIGDVYLLYYVIDENLSH